jgi:hypothetical protein
MVNLAKGHSDAGRPEKAIELYEPALRLMRTKMGRDHPTTYICMAGLATGYRRAGRYEDAIKLNRETLELRQANLGLDHPDTIHSMNNLAKDYRAAGRHVEASELDEEALRLRQAKLGRDDPRTLQALNDLAWRLLSTGMETRIDDAMIKEMRRACKLTQHGYAFGTLALAEFRLRNFSEAIEAVHASIEKSPPPVYPIGLAILAMSHRQLNHKSEQIEFREAFNQAMQSDSFKNDPDCQKFAAELKSLFDSIQE